jgi:hypothetical protein
MGVVGLAVRMHFGLLILTTTAEPNLAMTASAYDFDELEGLAIAAGR